MKKNLLLEVALVFSLTCNAQEIKSKTYKQHKSAETSRYVTKKEAIENPVLLIRLPGKRSNTRG